MHYYWLSVVLITVPCAIQVVDTLGGASVLIKLLVYSNSYAQVSDGTCCDGLCVGNCDHKFKLCLHPYTDPIDKDVNNCDIWETSFGPYREQNINIFPEEDPPYNVHVDQMWPGNVVFKVYVLDEDLQLDDYVDTLYSILNETQPSIWGDTKFYRRTIYGARSRSPTNLLFEYAVVCDRNFTGPYCNISCDDFSGGCDSVTPLSTTTSTSTASLTSTSTTTTLPTPTSTPTTKTTPTSSKSPSTKSSTAHSDASETHSIRDTTTTENYPTTADPCSNGMNCPPLTCPGNYICYNGGVCQGGERAQSCQCTPCFAGPSCLMEICDDAACLQGGIEAQCEVMGCKCSFTQDSGEKVAVIPIATGVGVSVVIFGVLIALLIYFIKKSRRNDTTESYASGGTFDSFENPYENDIYDDIVDKTVGVSYQNEGDHIDADDGYLRAGDVNSPGDSNTIPHDQDQTVPKEIYGKVPKRQGEEQTIYDEIGDQAEDGDDGFLTPVNDNSPVDGNNIPHDPEQTVPKEIYGKVPKRRGNEYSQNPQNTQNINRGESDFMEQTIPKSRYSTKRKINRNIYTDNTNRGEQTIPKRRYSKKLKNNGNIYVTDPVPGSNM